MYKNFKNLLFSIIASCVIAGSANAGVVFGTTGGNVSITLTESLNFTATGSSNDGYVRFIFEDAYSYAPGQQYSFSSGNIQILRNGVAFGSSASAWGPLSFNLGNWDMNDFGISFVGASFSVGDVITLTQGTSISTVPAAFLPDQAPSSVMMVGNGANQLAASRELSAVTVPEPSSIALLSLALMGIGFARSRKK